jgi:hypothetical protein
LTSARNRATSASDVGWGIFGVVAAAWRSAAVTAMTSGRGRAAGRGAGRAGGFDPAAGAAFGAGLPPGFRAGAGAGLPRTFAFSAAVALAMTSLGMNSPPVNGLPPTVAPPFGACAVLPPPAA